VDEGACKLDQAFEELICRAVLSKPEMFEHVVRFVILLLIKADKVALITGMVP
jgi:hypothetical protein